MTRCVEVIIEGPYTGIENAVNLRSLRERQTKALGERAPRIRRTLGANIVFVRNGGTLLPVVQTVKKEETK